MNDEAGAGTKGSFRIVLALVVLAVALPHWVVDFPPMVDYPQQLGQVGLSLRLDLPGYEIYRMNWLTPYLLPYFVLRGLAALLPIEIAGKVFLSLMMVGLLLANLRLHSVAGRHPYWVFLCVPFLYSYANAWGFVFFQCGMACAILLVSQCMHQLGRRSDGFPWGVALLSLALLFTHILAWGMGGLASLVVVALTKATWRRKAKVAVAMAMSGVPCLLYFLGLRLSPVQQTFLRMVKTATFAQKLDRLPAYLIHGMAEGIGPLLGVAVCAVVVAWYLLARGGDDAQRAGFHRPLAAAAFVMLVLYFVVPSWLLGVGLIYERFALPAVCLLLACLPRCATRRVSLGPCMVLGVALAAPLCMTWTYRLVASEAPGMRRAIDAIPAHQRVLGLVVSPASAVTGLPVFLHAPAYYLASRGRMISESFAEQTNQYVRYRKAPPQTKRPMGFGWAPERFFDAESMTPLWDYFLVRIPPQSPPVEPLGLFWPRCRHRVRIHFHEGDWWVMRRTETTAGGVARDKRGPSPGESRIAPVTEGRTP